MALIKCPDCGKQISDKAGACPNCGCPIANRPTTVKIRCLSDDRHVKRMVFTINGRRVVGLFALGHPQLGQAPALSQKLI